MGNLEHEATQAFQLYTVALFEEVGAKPKREVLEQYMCFAAAVWNATVLLTEYDDESVLQDLVLRVNRLAEPDRSRHLNLLLRLALSKARQFGEQRTLVRHVHVVRAANDELRVRAEILQADQWLASGEPLRMGLVE